MKKIIIINGSPRKKGATATILKKFEENLRNKYFYDVKYYNISDLSFDHCVGCCNCYNNGLCVFHDDAEKISIEISKASALIIGTPTYSSNISGQLKCFIDRGHFVLEQLLKGKYVIGVVTGENYGKTDAKKILNKLFHFSGGQIVGSISYKIKFNSNVFRDKKVYNKVNNLTRKLDKKIVNESNYYMQILFHYIVFQVGIKSFVLKNKKTYQGIINLWKEKYILEKNETI